MCCPLVQCLYKDTVETHVTFAPPPPLPSCCLSPSLSPPLSSCCSSSSIYPSPSLPLPSPPLLLSLPLYLPVPFPPAVPPPPSPLPSSSPSGPAGQVQVDGAHIRQPPPVSHWPPAAEGDGVPWRPCPLGSDTVAEDTGHLGSR